MAKWERNYELIITPDNIKDAAKTINRTIKEACKYYAKEWGEDKGAVDVKCGPAIILIDSIKLCGDIIELHLGEGGLEIARILIDEGLLVKFHVFGVKTNKGQYDYGDSMLFFEDYDRDGLYSD